LDKALYDNHLCLVALNKQQIHLEEVKESTEKLGNQPKNFYHKENN